MGGGGGWGLSCPGHHSCQSIVHNGYLYLFRNMYLEIGMDRMLKLFREFINQTGFAVYTGYGR